MEMQRIDDAIGVLIDQLGVKNDVSVRELVLEFARCGQPADVVKPIIAGCFATTAMQWEYRSRDGFAAPLAEAELFADLLTLQQCRMVLS